MITDSTVSFIDVKYRLLDTDLALARHTEGVTTL